ncbi:MAG TPA: serine hydrolase domain-containing protein [Pyrinomonadaceae bacterium]|nr:serine hydrolase domain-containing protein [Pyrinomonadaceae bacterium]
MKKQALALFVIVILLLATTPLSVTGQKNGTDFTDLEKTFLKDFEERGAPGAAIAIISGDRIIYSKLVGVGNVETGVPVTADTLFLIGVTSRIFVSAGLASLAEEEKVPLDEPIGSRISGLNAKVAKLSINHLLSNTGGMKQELYRYGPRDDKGLEQYVRTISDEYFFAEPGKAFSTSTISFALAGYVAEQLGKKPFGDVMQDRFKKLGMYHSTFRQDIAMTYQLAQGHQVSGVTAPIVVRPFVDNAIFRADSMMFSTLNDMARFAIAFMNGGKVDGRQILSPSVIARMSTPVARVYGTNVLEEGEYGYGMLIYDYRGVRVLEDDSVWLGFSTRCRMVPEHRFAIIILANSNVGGFHETVDKAFETVMPVKPRQGVKPKTALKIDEAESQKYVGQYVNPPDDIEIGLKNGQLVFRQIGMELPMSKIGEQRFQIQPPASPGTIELKMMTGEDGKVEFMYSSLRAFKKIR